jgi:hypothetical protein
LDFVLERVENLELVGTTGPSVPLEEVSVLSISRLFDATEGVLDPVLAGDWTSLSFTDEGWDVGVAEFFSLPVIASEIARRPLILRPLLEIPSMPVAGGSGEELPLLSLANIGERSDPSSSRLVTVGEPPKLLGDRVIGGRALKDRSRRLEELLW